MRRIDQPSMGKRVPGKHVAEFIMHFRLRNMLPWQQGNARKNRDRAKSNNCQPLSLRESAKFLLQPRKDRLTPTRGGSNERQANAEDDPL